MIYFPLHGKRFQEELKGGVRNHHLLQNLVYFSGYEFLKALLTEKNDGKNEVKLK